MSFRERYFEALGQEPSNDPGSDTSTSALGKLLERALATRQFEIDLYWKRATYFWAFQLVAFTLLGFLLKDGILGHYRRLLIPAPVGIVTSFAGYLTARGSKFWQENWESHVDVLESELKERLTQVILCRQRPQFSVSRVNQTLSLFIAGGWSLLLIVGAFPALARWLQTRSANLQGGAVVVGVVAVCVWLGFRTRTSLPGKTCTPENPEWVQEPAKPQPPYMIWRKSEF